MDTNALIKYGGAILKRVGNAIGVTNKLLSISQDKLIPYRKRNKWGYCAPDKNLIIECIYDDAYLFINGEAIVKLNEGWVLINEKGKQIRSFEVSGKENSITDIIKNNPHQGYLSLIYDIANKGNVNALKYKQAIDELVLSDAGANFAIKKGLEQNSKTHREEFFVYSAETYFIEGKRTKYNQEIRKVFDAFKVLLKDTFEGFVKSAYDTSISGHLGNLLDIIYGKEFVNQRLSKRSSNFIVPKENLLESSAEEKSKSMATIEQVNQNTYDAFKMYDNVSSFSEGLARVELQGKIGFISLAGELLIQCVYDDAGDFSQGLTEVKFNGKWGYINKDGIQYWED